jgi:hypothetical protein
MEMYDGTYFGAPLKRAIADGQVPLSRLDDMVLRILRSMFRVGVFDRPAAPERDAYAAGVATPGDAQLAREVAEQGTVLLKNNGAVLTLNGLGKTIAVIGQPAGPVGVSYSYGGGGSSHVLDAGFYPDVVSPLQGIAQRGLANGDKVVCAEGSVTADAVAAATAADVAIVFVREGDRAALRIRARALVHVVRLLRARREEARGRQRLRHVHADQHRLASRCRSGAGLRRRTAVERRAAEA